MCAACAEDHPMGPDCVKKARERRMKEEKAKVSFLFLLINILFYTFLRRRREERKHPVRKKHQQLIFQKDL